MIYLGIAGALEERCRANKANVVVPHHRVRCVVPWNLELVVEY
jgi:hypothetical protein